MAVIVEQFAPDVQVYTADGARVPLRTYWGHRPIVLTFLRHFGCAFCRDFIIKLRAAYPDFVERGAEITAIAQGNAPQTAHFANILRLPFPLLADPSREVYQAFELLEVGYTTLLHHSVMREGMALAGRGELPDVGYTIQTMLPTNNMSFRQMGGTFVIDEQGRVRYAHVDKQVYDHPQIPDLLEIVGSLTAQPVGTDAD
ncbi:MAG TPA: peroxiredoxin-like family protein [Herpetosiphonaceae bacterium]